MEVEMSSSGIYNIALRRVPVDEGLYEGFTDDVIKLIHESRELQKAADEKLRKLSNYSNQDQDQEELEVDACSDTESAYQWFDDIRASSSSNSLLNEAFCTDSNDVTDISSWSSMSESNDGNYPQIETSRNADCDRDYYSNHVEDTVIITPTKSSINLTGEMPVQEETPSENQIGCQSIKPKKIIVPEPELRDPNYFGFDDPFEDVTGLSTPQRMKQAMNKKLATLGRLFPMFKD